MATKKRTKRIKNSTITVKPISFHRIAEVFRNRINNLWLTLPLVMNEIVGKKEVETAKFKEYVEKYGKKKDQVITIELPSGKIDDFEKLRKGLSQTNMAIRTVPRSLLTAMISEFDLLVHELATQIYTLTPELLNNSEKKLSCSEVMKYSDIEELRSAVMEGEIDNLLYGSHLDLLGWFENRGIEIKPAIQLKRFIELTERRNLIMHADARINKRYIDKCKANEITVPEGKKLGDELEVDEAYYNEAATSVLEVGLKLVQLSWRKFQPQGRNDADIHLNNTVVELIENGKYDLAVDFVDFALKCSKNKPSAMMQHMLMINKIQALKWAGKAKEANDQIAQIDWSALNISFQLAKNVLTDDFTEAIKLVKKIGKDGTISKRDYKTWPIFRELRKNVDFMKTFKKIFKEDLNNEPEAQSEKADK